MAALRILVADANEHIAHSLEAQLTHLGYDVIAVAHMGAAAIDLATRLSPDLIIMDIRLPEVAGTAAAAWINAIRATPILVLTAATDHETIRRAEGAGALGYLVKPVNEAKLSPAITIALARFRELQGLRAQVTALEDMVEARKLIERAKGILMQRLGLSERDVYERLRQRARDTCAKMKDSALRAQPLKPRAPRLGIIFLTPLLYEPELALLRRHLTHVGVQLIAHGTTVAQADWWLATTGAEGLLVGHALADAPAVQAFIARTRLPAIGWGGAPPADAPTCFAAWLPQDVDLAVAARVIRQTLAHAVE